MGWGKQSTTLILNPNFYWQEAKEVVFGERSDPSVDKNWVATYIGGVTFVSDANSSLQHSILLPGSKMKPVIGIVKNHMLFLGQALRQN